MLIDTAREVLRLRAQDDSDPQGTKQPTNDPLVHSRALSVPRSYSPKEFFSGIAEAGGFAEADDAGFDLVGFQVEKADGAEASGELVGVGGAAGVDLEYAVADLGVVQKRLEKLRTSGRHGSPAEREANALEEALLERIEPHLAEGHPLRGLPLEEDEEKRLRGYRFLTQKPVLVLVNVDEARLPEVPAIEEDGQERHGGPEVHVAALAGKLEAEIAQLSPEDARIFLEDLGIGEASRGRMIRLTYALLGLFSFFTGGEDECRAWTLRRGATAVDAAAAIHSDLARGFIRAEVVTFDDLMACGSTAEARRRGLLRSEGKAYQVQDGDVIEVLFNVAR